MRSFLAEVAQSLYQTHGGGIADLTLVFPNRRAGLFFSRELSAIVAQPTWSPRYGSIDDLLRDYTGLTSAHHLTLIAILYEVYRTHLKDTTDTFDDFYSWGNLIIADFDTLDKYLIDAKRLYANLSELSEIDAAFADDSPEKALILQFWNTVRQAKNQSKHADTFIGIWEHLYKIYVDFKQRLTDRNIGYSGMIYRTATEKLRSDSGQQIGAFDGAGHYVFIGFNALNPCEQLLLSTLQHRGQASFFWDSDHYYVSDTHQEAGSFLRRNIAKFGPVDAQPPKHFAQAKQLEIINTPGDILQCKALYTRLQELHAKQGAVDSETAIVLTDENLLPAVLHSIPTEITKINITMGAPLVQSAPVVFLNRMITLQRSRKAGEYMYQNVTDLLTHPYLARLGAPEIAALHTLITSAGKLYIDPDTLGTTPLLARIFIAATLTADTASDYYLTLIEELAYEPHPDNADIQMLENNEFATALADNLRQLASIISDAGIDVSLSVYHSLLGQINSSTRIPYEGQPLQGLQIMGILESRCLDFKNVFILSLCDDTFPGNRPIQSYIPLTLRKGFGLPTPTDHAAVWAYYFYRLLQRSENICLMYSSTQGGTSTGEQSRYLYQLEYESPHTIRHTNLDLTVTPQPDTPPIVIPKTADILNALRTMRYSPSSINAYIDCPLRFYLSRIAKIKPPTTPAEELAPADGGSILHRAIELLYTPIIGQTHPQPLIRQIIQNPDLITTTINQATADKLEGRLLSPQVASHVEHLKSLIRNQLNSILNFDASSTDLQQIQTLEHPVTTQISTAYHTVKIAGIADRIDLLTDHRTRIVDYKSGTVDLSFDGTDSLFSNLELDKGKYARHNGAALQALIYSLSSTDNQVVPAIFKVKDMTSSDYTPYFTDKETDTTLSAMSVEIKTSVQAHLATLLTELLNDQIPFKQSTYVEDCKWCDYKTICKRNENPAESATSNDESAIETLNN